MEVDTMNGTLAAARAVRVSALLAVGLLGMLAIAGPAALAAHPDTAGNNGTVKIHDGAGEPSPEILNEPQVCTFHLHFFFADPEQSGTWQIQEWSPGDKGAVVWTGTYDTFGDGEDRQPATGAISLPDGHYKLFWDGDTSKHDKMKVFWVRCAPTAPPVAAATPTPTPAGGGQPAGATSAPAGAGLPAAPKPTPTPAPSSGQGAGGVGGIIGGPSSGAGPSSGNRPASGAGPASGSGPASSTGPTSEVLGLTGTPPATPPPTDTTAAPSSSSSDSWGLVALALAWLIAATASIARSRLLPAALRRSQGRSRIR
jgi:hypothetical protein